VTCTPFSSSLAGMITALPSSDGSIGGRYSSEGMYAHTSQKAACELEMATLGRRLTASTVDSDSDSRHVGGLRTEDLIDFVKFQSKFGTTAVNNVRWRLHQARHECHIRLVFLGLGGRARASHPWYLGSTLEHGGSETIPAFYDRAWARGKERHDGPTEQRDRGPRKVGRKAVGCTPMRLRDSGKCSVPPEASDNNSVWRIPRCSLVTQHREAEAAEAR